MLQLTPPQIRIIGAPEFFSLNSWIGSHAPQRDSFEDIEYNNKLVRNPRELRSEFGEVQSTYNISVGLEERKLYVLATPLETQGCITSCSLGRVS